MSFVTFSQKHTVALVIALTCAWPSLSYGKSTTPWSRIKRGGHTLASKLTRLGKMAGVATSSFNVPNDDPCVFAQLDKFLEEANASKENEAALGEVKTKVKRLVIESVVSQTKTTSSIALHGMDYMGFGTQTYMRVGLQRGSGVSTETGKEPSRTTITRTANELKIVVEQSKSLNQVTIYEAQYKRPFSLSTEDSPYSALKPILESSAFENIKAELSASKLTMNTAQADEVTHSCGEMAGLGDILRALDDK